MKTQKVHEQLQQDLQDLKLYRMAEMYKDALDDAARTRTSMLDFLGFLVSEEAAARRTRALQRRIKAARLPKRKTLEGYDLSWPTKIPKGALLRLFDCDFISNAQNAVLIGGTGLGKTHLLTALGYKACELGHSVRFTKAPEMLTTLMKAQKAANLEKTMRAYTRPSLLLLDELGYLAIDKTGADLLFQVVATRYETGSIVLSTNRLFREWGKILDQDPTTATAMIDRLMHHGEALLLEGETYRNPKKKNKNRTR